MSERYEQPRAPEAPPKYATPFELAIYEYEKKTYAHHKAVSDGAPANESDEARKKRIAEWEATREHLRKERLRLKSLARLHSELLIYRNKASGLTDDDLLKEKHHPAKLLAKNLVANNEPQPSPDHVAHHIVPGKGRWLQDDILDVRLALHDHGIRINDPVNGIFLPDKVKDKGHCCTPKAPVHKKFGWNYERWIVNTLPDTLKKNAFLKRLEIIKQQLRDGNHPPEIVESKDPKWNP